MSIYVILSFFFSLFDFRRIVLPKSSVVTVANDANRPYLIEGKYYSPVIDSVEERLKALGIKCVCIARLLNKIVGKDAYGNVYAPNGMFERALIEKRLRSFIYRSPYSFSRLEYRAWLYVLRTTSAKKVIAILPSRELCCACHHMGVWVCDVQHGVNGDSREASPYYWGAMRRNQPREWHPDSFLCWDGSAKEFLVRWTSCFEGIEVHVIGNPWLNRFLTDSAFACQVAKAFECTPYDNDSRPVVLITLQWGCREIENGVIHQSLIDAIKLTSSRYRWLIRLHPNQLQGFAPEEGDVFRKIFNEELYGHAEWERTTLAPLPLILREVDLHITWHSSVTVEAALMGIRSALLNPELEAGGVYDGLFDYFTSRGFAQVVDPNIEGILNWLEMDKGEIAPLLSLDEVLVTYNEVIRSISEGG